jgi:hypothetical protein
MIYLFILLFVAFLTICKCQEVTVFTDGVISSDKIFQSEVNSLNRHWLKNEPFWIVRRLPGIDTKVQMLYVPSQEASWKQVNYNSLCSEVDHALTRESVFFEMGNWVANSLLELQKDWIDNGRCKVSNDQTNWDNPCMFQRILRSSVFNQTLPLLPESWWDIALSFTEENVTPQLFSWQFVHGLSSVDGSWWIDMKKEVIADSDSKSWDTVSFRWIFNSKAAQKQWNVLYSGTSDFSYVDWTSASKIQYPQKEDLFYIIPVNSNC